MARLPVPGADLDAWGDVLNSYLLTEHNPDGTHNAPANHIGVTPSGLILSTNVQAALEEVAARGATGAVGGDLTGALPNPQLAAGVVTDAKVSNAAAIAEGKLALASDAAAGTPSRRTLGPGPTQAAQGDQVRLGRNYQNITTGAVASGGAGSYVVLATALGLSAAALDITFTLTQTTDVIARANMLCQLTVDDAAAGGLLAIKDVPGGNQKGATLVTFKAGWNRLSPAILVTTVAAGTYTWRLHIASPDAGHVFQVWAGGATSIGASPIGWELFAA